MVLMNLITDKLKLFLKKKNLLDFMLLNQELQNYTQYRNLDL